jgi:hypothetical protein
VHFVGTKEVGQERKEAEAAGAANPAAPREEKKKRKDGGRERRSKMREEGQDGRWVRMWSEQIGIRKK